MIATDNKAAALAKSKFNQLWNGWRASLMAAGYEGKSHLVWYNSDNPDTTLEQTVKKVMKRDEPIFLYRCGSKVQSPPTRYYWRMMDELRIYKLELKDGE
ncbi:MAG: hypothetical protein ACYTXI_40420 [Nostoc sp.]